MAWRIRLINDKGEATRAFSTQLSSGTDTTVFTDTVTFIPIVQPTSVAPSASFLNDMSVLGNFRGTNDKKTPIRVDVQGSGMMRHTGLSGSAQRSFSFAIGIWNASLEEFIPNPEVVTIGITWNALARVFLISDTVIPANAIWALMVRREVVNNLRTEMYNLHTIERIA